MDRDVAELVIGRRIGEHSLQAGILHGYERLVVAEETYPALAPRVGGKVTGVVAEGISAAELARMQFFESEEFAPAARDVELASGVYVSAQTFLACEALEYTDQRWDYAQWKRHDKEDYLVLAREWMRGYGEREAHQLEALWGSARREQIARLDDGAGNEQQTSGGYSHD